MPTLHLQPQHDAAIREAGKAAFPNECCGFMLGKLEGEPRVVTKLLPADNVREEEEQYHRFTISPRDYMKADKAARAEGLEVVGFYHSHPDAPARPSQYDLDHAWPIYSYVIVSVLKGEPDVMTSWLLNEDRTAFDEQAIEVK